MTSDEWKAPEEPNWEEVTLPYEISRYIPEHLGYRALYDRDLNCYTITISKVFRAQTVITTELMERHQAAVGWEVESMVHKLETAAPDPIPRGWKNLAEFTEAKLRFLADLHDAPAEYLLGEIKWILDCIEKDKAETR